MAWRAIIDDDLFSGMNAHEIAAVRKKALADGQTDPVAEVISQVTLDVRESIRSCAANRLSPDPTHVPEACIYRAVPLIRHRLITRFGSLIAGSDERSEEYRESVRYFDKIASCARSVERYGEEESAPAPVKGPSITSPSPTFGRASQDGI